MPSMSECRPTIVGVGGWTQRRLAVIAGLSFALGLAVTLLAAWGGPLAAILAAGALFMGGRAAYPRIKQSLAAEEDRQQQVRARAEEQHRWAARGDMRGVYGTEGAELMREVSPPLPIIPPGDDLEVATVVHTAAELTAMLEEKLPCWRYAAFVSVCVLRRDAVASRVRDARMGYATPTGETLRTDFEAGLFFTERLSELSRLVDQINSFMLSPAFQDVFGDREESADAEGIVHAAHRLMDYHEQVLALSERCRGAKVPLSCSGLQRDAGLLIVAPLEGFHTFIATFTERLTEMADVARYATGDVQLDPVTLSITDDDDLLSRIVKQLEQISRGG